MNLPPFNDQIQYRKNKQLYDTEIPRQGIDDEVAFNPMDTRGKKVSFTKLQLAEPYTVIFHELAEAFSKIDAGTKIYGEGHNDAMRREVLLRVQRPNLTLHNPGSDGPIKAPDTYIT